jgi:hypothetical protein
MDKITNDIYNISTKDIRRIGKELSKGMLDAVLFALVIFATFFILFGAIFNYFSAKDSTDSPTRRSGLRLYTDHLTGVQYIGNKYGLTIRINKHGQPVLTPPDKE